MRPLSEEENQIRVEFNILASSRCNCISSDMNQAVLHEAAENDEDEVEVPQSEANGSEGDPPAQHDENEPFEPEAEEEIGKGTDSECLSS